MSQALCLFIMLSLASDFSSKNYWLRPNIYRFHVLAVSQVLFGAMAVTVSGNYDQLLNFTYPISVQAYSMLIPRPKELSRLYLFIAPFTLDVSYFVLMRSKVD